MRKFPTELLKAWFLEHKRSLPWRDEPTPYRVWISEIMLQQTQVAVVIPYFDRWMQQFPTIEKLAQAPLEEVIKCWEGLGYYSRARNIQKAAQDIVTRFEGKFPSKREDIETLPGIGPYTQGAILSFAFQQKAAAVDGNVLRVLSRFLADDEPIDSPKGRKKLHAYAESILPDKDPWIISEALIELGALVCSKKAQCFACPLQKECLAFRDQIQDTLPKKKCRPETTKLIRQVAIIFRKEEYMVQKSAQGKIMADLYEFPYLEGLKEMPTPHFEKAWGLKLNYIKPLAVQKHSFTRYQAELYPHLVEAESKNTHFEWKTLQELHALPFSSGHKRILATL